MYKEDKSGYNNMIKNSEKMTSNIGKEPGQKPRILDVFRKKTGGRE